MPINLGEDMPSDMPERHTYPAALLSVVKSLFWCFGVQTTGSSVMSHSRARTSSYQATRWPGPWVGESPESQPKMDDRKGVSQTHGHGFSREVGR